MELDTGIEVLPDISDNIQREKETQLPEVVYSKSNYGEQTTRDLRTTEFYDEFVSAYKEKVKFIKRAKIWIFVLCLIWITAFVAADVAAIWCFAVNGGRDTADMLSLLTVLAPTVLAIIGMLHIVTVNVFPEDEDKHVSEIAKQIQNNDIENRKLSLQLNDKNDK